MAEANTERHDRLWLEVASFICFTVLFSFFPIVALYLVRAADGDYLTLPQLAADGGILTIAISLAANALSRLVVSNTRWPELKVVAAACSAWVIGCGSIFYALRYLQRTANSVFFIDLSFSILVVSIVLATLSRFLPEGDE
jgi:hypothetical protein